MFRVRYQDNGYYKIIQVKTGRYLNVSGEYVHKGVNVETWTELSGFLQNWLIEQATDGLKIRAMCNGEYLDAKGGALENGTNIQTWSGNDSNAQVFDLIPIQNEETTTETTTTTPVKPDRLYCDTNDDGEIDIMDVIVLNKYLLGAGKLTNTGKKNSDTNGDGYLDTTDSLNILKRVVEILKDAEFPVK